MNDPSTNRFSLTEMVMDLVAIYTKTFFVRADRFTIAQMPVPMVTTVKQCSFLDATNSDGCKDWLFTTMQPHRTDGMHAFNFVQNITAAASRLAVAARYDSEPYPWPAELLDGPNFSYDPRFPHSTILANGSRATRDRVYVQRSYRDAITAQSVVRYRFYMSNTPFPQFGFISPQPHPTEIFWEFGTNNGRLLCLHDDVTVDQQNQVYPQQFFPRTNFKRRAPFDIITQNPQPEKGLFIKIKKRFFPPIPGKIITLAA